MENILIKVYISGLRDDKSRKSILLNSLKTLTEAAQYVRLSEAAVSVAKNHGASTSAAKINLMNYRGNFNKRGRGRELSDNRDR